MMRPSLTAILLHLTILASHAIYLDIHVPLSYDDDCLMTQTLRANELLRSYSSSQNSDSEQVDLFSKHTPHITLFLADFDLELHGGNYVENDRSLAQLNVTKVNSFLETISTKINLTQVVQGMDCTLSLQSLMEHNDDSNNSKKFYTVNGSFTMLNVKNTPCLKALSNAVVVPLESFVKRPVIVPSWVASLKEPERSAAIYRSRKYGSPNVFEGFTPHLTVGFDPSTKGADTAWREDAMEQWNEGFTLLMRNDGCRSSVKGVAVARNGIGGTVLANSRMRYWNVVKHDPFHAG
ncbi:hypothetical protein ACHAWT_005672 [Skeletonema menzelii]